MKIMKSILTCLFCTCISLLSVETAFAAKDRYTVEIIVFRQPASPVVLQELWSSNLPVPYQDSTQSKNRAESQYRHLNAVSARLNRSGYPVLLHEANTVTLHHRGKVRSLPIKIATSITHDWLVSGVVNVQNIGFLQMNLKLLTRPNNTTPSGIRSFPEGGNPMLPWETSRRIHPRELHYFDHPLYGMLVAVYPQA